MNNDNNTEGAPEDLSPNERKDPKVKKIILPTDLNLAKKESKSSQFDPGKAMVVSGKDRESMKRILTDSEELQKNPGKYKVGQRFTVPRNSGELDPDWEVQERVWVLEAEKDGVGKTAPIYKESELIKQGCTVQRVLGYKLAKGDSVKLFTDAGMERLQKIQPKK